MYAKQIFELILQSYEDETHVTRCDVEWIYREYDECVAIAVRGTELDRSSWFFDLSRNFLSMFPWKHKSIGWGSMGYMFAAKDAVRDIYNFLEKKNVSHKPIILCGHSLGSAVSFMCAKIMHDDGAPIAAWVGTGSVNCMLSEPCADFPCFNYKYEEDIISIFPPKFFGFKQPCKFIHIGIDDSDGRPFNIGDISDHKMVKYMKFAPNHKIL